MQGQHTQSSVAALVFAALICKAFTAAGTTWTKLAENLATLSALNETSNSESQYLARENPLAAQTVDTSPSPEDSSSSASSRYSEARGSFSADSEPSPDLVWSRKQSVREGRGSERQSSLEVSFVSRFFIG